MPVGNMRQTIFNDTNLSLFQQSILDQFSQVGKIPFMNGTKLDDIDLITGQANTVDHKLGRKATGYFIFLKNTTADVWNDPIAGETNIIFRCSSNVTVSLWVF